MDAATQEYGCVWKRIDKHEVGISTTPTNAITATESTKQSDTISSAGF